MVTGKWGLPLNGAQAPALAIVPRQDDVSVGVGAEDGSAASVQAPSEAPTVLLPPPAPRRVTADSVLADAKRRVAELKEELATMDQKRAELELLERVIAAGEKAS